MRATTAPILIRSGSVDRSLRRRSLGDLEKNEAWLQELLARHPEVLPVAEIEPAFEQLIPAGREVACANGYIDNLFLTAGGNIVVVETKLHANAQARREVVAQTLSYIAALAEMRYEQFEAAICAAQHEGSPPTSLHSLVKDKPEALDECAFSDAISANLARGRVLALVVGDGIRREAESLAAVLQSHAGSHFTFALVELAIYETQERDILVVPSILAKTLMIERAVVRVDSAGGSVIVEPIKDAISAATGAARSLSQIQFDEIMESRRVGLSKDIRAFVESLEPQGVYPELLGSLNLKAEVGRDSPANLGYIQKNGQLWTNALGWKMPPEPTLRYVERLSAAIGGMVARGSDGSPYVSINGKTAPRIEDLLPTKASEWRQIVNDLLHELRSEKDS